MPQHLIIHSADRSSGTSSDFRVNIPVFKNAGQVALLSASIPNTLYNVFSGRNGISWTRGGVDYSTTITSGAYGVTDLLAVVGAAMLAADGAGGYSVSYTPVTMKLSITSTDASFYLRLAVQTNQMWSTLGFTGTANTAPALTQIADSVIRLDHPSYLMIDISELPSQDCVNTTWSRGNYIVPMSGISQYVEVYNRNTSFDQLQQYSLGAGVASLRVRLTRPDGTAADLNGAEWTFMIGIQCPCW